jgi:ParB/RepB/Spo0J family partition protein
MSRPRLHKEIVMPQLLTKPLSWFHPDPGQPRKSFDEAADRALGQSMKEYGQLQPVGAKPDGTLLWGGRRFRAAELVGIKELSVIITDKPLSDSEIRIIQQIENLHRTDLSGYERWLAGSELMHMNPNWQMKDLAEHLKLDPSMVTRLLSPSRCIDEVHEALKAGKIGISDCYAISKLPESEQAALLAHKLHGASRDDLDRQVRKQRNDTPAVKVDHVRIALPNNVAVVLSGNGLGMAEVVTVLSDVLKEAKRAAPQYDVKTFQSMMKDKAR